MHYKPGKDKGMIQLPFSHRAKYLHPSAKHWTKIISIPSKNNGADHGEVHDLLHRHVFTIFYQEELLEWPWTMVDAQPPNNSQHQRSFLSEKPIGFKPSDSNFSWQQQPRRIQWKHSQVQNGVMSFTLSGAYIKGALNSQFFFSAVVMCNSSRRRRGSWLWWNPTFITRQQFQPCSQIGPFPQVGVKIENTWNHHLAKVLLHTFFSRTTPLTKILRNLQNTFIPNKSL